MRIGIDFDNTIVGYDQVFASLAVSWGMLPEGIAANKAGVREFLRGREGGEMQWQRLQGRVYGAEMGRAQLMEGVGDFLAEARSRGDEIFIVSHKTMYGHFDPDRVNLREASMNWMEQHHFFDPDQFGLKPENVFFLSTREKKIQKIEALDLDWFIDDLPEVLRADGFPENTGKIWFVNGQDPVPDKGAGIAYKSWDAIREALYP